MKTDWCESNWFGDEVEADHVMLDPTTGEILQSLETVEHLFRPNTSLHPKDRLEGAIAAIRE